MAIHAHLDLLDFDADFWHRGGDYHLAARRVRDLFTDGDWTTVTPYSIDYDRDWEQTGDTKLRLE